MKIREMPPTERPREKLLHRGEDVLSDAELLAIILGSGVRGSSAVDLAQQLLAEYGGVRGIVTARRDSLCSHKGVGLARFVLLKAAAELVRRSLLEPLQKRDALLSPGATRDYLVLKMRHYEHEMFACLFMDNQHRVIMFEELFRGTIDSASVHPREVVKRALHHNAAAVILVHNHPSGCARPSRADMQITEELKAALQLVDVRVLDHIVIGEKVTSFAESHLI